MLVLTQFVSSTCSDTLPSFHCGTVVNPITRMGVEHDGAGIALAQLRQLTDDFTPPAWACNTDRALFDALLTFEQDMHQHIHKENNVLFPKAVLLERQKAVRTIEIAATCLKVR